MYVHDCPIELKIPVLLIVTGGCHIILSGTRFSQFIFQSHKSKTIETPVEERYVAKRDSDVMYVSESNQDADTIGSEVVATNRDNSVEIEGQQSNADDDQEETDEEDENLPEEVPIKMNIPTLIECIIMVFFVTWFVAGKAYNTLRVIF